MNGPRLIPAVICLLVAGVCGCGAEKSHQADRIFDDQAMKFFKELDTTSLRMLAAQYGGRPAGALDSLATDGVSRITGTEKPEGVAAVAAYCEFYFNAGKYLNKPIIFVKSKKIRPIVARTLQGSDLAVFRRTNRIPPASIMLGSGLTVARRASKDLNVRDMIAAGRITMEDAEATRSAGALGDRWNELYDDEARRVPMARLGGRYVAFINIELCLLPGSGQDWPGITEVLVGSGGHTHSAGCELIANLRDAWKNYDAEGVNAIIAKIKDVGSAGKGYPDASRLKWELFYNDIHKGHPAFVGFVAAFIMFIVAIATNRRWARNSAMAIMILSTLVITAAWILRWIAGGEAWYLPPMMKQYGAMLSSAVLAAVLAVILELFRKYNYIALAAAFYGAVVLVWVYFGNMIMGPDSVNSSISAAKGILKDPLMIIHVSVIVVGHALAGMTVVTSVAYVGIAFFKGLEGKSTSSAPGLFGPVGNSSLAVVDRCNLILAQIACWTLIVGTLLGAWWADYAWSRWWGWDAKETWALITCLLFVVVLHVRFVLPSRYRGLLTAVFCILGGVAMLFNWFVVNYLFSGLHSYG
ncbi:MAG: cytochrome c biogenesis protein CcsA [Phycisphaerae bacterium]|jgi:ABC-type transport system involved in cytochrome c biogenesis permease subunit|nr:cytochrome c biogenesis protein CcsA [Phycisphaerae bacterium]